MKIIFLIIFKIIKNLLISKILFQNLFSFLLFRKHLLIHFSLVIKNLNDLDIIVQENIELISKNQSKTHISKKLELFFEDFMENIFSYEKKIIQNLKEFFFKCFKIKYKISDEDNTTKNPDIPNEKEIYSYIERFLTFIHEKINFYLIKILSSDKNFLEKLNENNIITFNFIKKIIGYNKIFKKQIHLPKNKKFYYSLLDLFLYNEKGLKKLQEIILLQKNFSLDYFNSQISNSINCAENETNFLFDYNLFDNFKMILKDNFYFLDSLEKSTEIFNIIYQENYKFLLKEVLHILRLFYNNQVSNFNSTRKIIKPKVIYVIEFTINFLKFKNKILKKIKLSNWDEQNKNTFLDFQESNLKTKNILFLLNKFSKDENNNVNNNIFSEGLTIMNTFIILLTKEFKEKSFCKLIENFGYNNLIKLNEETIEKIIHDCNEDLTNLLKDIELSKLNEDNESLIIENILYDVLMNINSELEQSLKKNPKSKYFGILSDKVKNIFNVMIYKINKNDQKDKNLNCALNKFNSFMNTLKINII